MGKRYVDPRWTPAVRRPSGRVALVVASLLVFSGLGSILGLSSSAARMRQLDGRTGVVELAPVQQPQWVTVVGWLGLPATVLLVVLFLVWFHRTFKAALAQRDDTHGGAGVVTFLWLLPVVNLMTCFGAVASIWDAGGRDPKARGSRALLAAWWIAGSSTVAMTIVGFAVGFSRAMSAVGDAMDAAQRGVEPPAVVFTQTAGEQRLLLILGFLGAVLSVIAAVSAAAFVLASTSRLGGRSRVGARLAALPDRIVALAIAATVPGLAALAVLAGQ